MMRTIVFQSHKPGPRPRWLDLCMQSVENWAATNSYTYEFIDDRLFDVLPDDLRARRGQLSIYPLTDLARVLYAKMLLTDGGFDRAVWIDADVLVFDPSNFIIEARAGLTLCREVWTWTDFKGSYSVRNKVNNCVLAVDKASDFLRSYPILAQRLIVEQGGDPSSLSVGTELFTAQEQQGRLEAHLLGTVLLVNPFVVKEFHNDGRSACARLQQAILERNPAAIHFANSFTVPIPNRIHVDSRPFSELAEFLIDNPHAATR